MPRWFNSTNFRKEQHQQLLGPVFKVAWDSQVNLLGEHLPLNDFLPGVVVGVLEDGGQLVPTALQALACIYLVDDVNLGTHTSTVNSD